MQKDQDTDEVQEFSFKSLFVPFTTIKAIHWIIIIGTVIFGSSLFNPFIYDDIVQLVGNPFVRSVDNIPYFLTSGNQHPGASGFDAFIHNDYKPLQYIIYTILFASFGLNPIYFHFFQLVIYIGNAILVFLLFRKIVNDINIAFFCSLLFLVHPINSEIAIYIADLQDALFLFFGLSSFYVVVLSKSSDISLRRLFLINGLIILSLLSKITGILFVFIITGYIIFFSPKVRRKIIFSISISLMFYLSLRFFSSFQYFQTIVPSLIQQRSLEERLLYMPGIFIYYLYTFLFPVNVTLAQDWFIKKITFENFYTPLFFIIIFIVIVIFIYKWILKNDKKLSKLFIFFVAWFSLGMLLHMQIIPLDFTVATRWFYFPVIGLLGMGAVVGRLVIQKRENKGNSKNINILIISMALLCIFLLSIVTIQRILYWKSSTTLFGHDIQYTQDSAQLNNLYAIALINEGNLDAAKPFIEKSILIDPMMGNNTDNLAQWYELKKNYPKARELYRKSININNGLSKTYPYAGLARIALVYDKNPEEVYTITKFALQKYPLDSELLKYFAMSQYYLGYKDAALESAQQLIYYAPSQQSYSLYTLIKEDRLSY